MGPCSVTLYMLQPSFGVACLDKICSKSTQSCSIDVNEEEGEGGQGGEKKSAPSCSIDVDEDYSEL